jgi:hypothetical protein
VPLATVSSTAAASSASRVFRDWGRSLARRPTSPRTSARRLPTGRDCAARERWLLPTTSRCDVSGHFTGDPLHCGRLPGLIRVKEIVGSRTMRS